MPEITIQAADGGHFSAYVAYPAALPAPCVIVIQEIFGVNAEMRGKCDDLAAEGYIALCPDLFWRLSPGITLDPSVPEDLQRGFALFGQFDAEAGLEDLKSTLAHARTLEECGGKVGCAGYCLGGKLAYMMACRSDADASVSYYGVGIENMLEEAGAIKKPLLMHIAGEDKFVPEEAQEKIQAALKTNSLVEVHVYPGADHAFARTHGAHYNAQAAALANGRTARFLADALK